MLICVMAVFEEEDLLPGALASLVDSGVDRVYVFDGAWTGFGDGISRDRTREIAGEYGAHVSAGCWSSQEAKRTAMFWLCGAGDGDHVFVFDADERLEGRFPDLDSEQHYNVLVKCVGPNDLPGVRGEWPCGDYFPDWKPELRVFAYSRSLECRWPGGYWDAGGRIEPYADPSGAPRLPVLDGVRFTHHGAERSPERIARKLAYYRREHPRRAERQARAWEEAPW